MVKNHNLAKHIVDIAWNKLITIISYKAEWAGKCVELVTPENTLKCARVVATLLKKIFLKEYTTVLIVN